MCESCKYYNIVEGSRGFHLSYWEHPRTNYTTFYSQNQIKCLQYFYSILVDVLKSVKLCAEPDGVESDYNLFKLEF